MPKAFPLAFRSDVVAVARQSDAPIALFARDFGISELCLQRMRDAPCQSIKGCGSASVMASQCPDDAVVEPRLTGGTSCDSFGTASAEIGLGLVEAVKEADMGTTFVNCSACDRAYNSARIAVCPGCGHVPSEAEVLQRLEQSDAAERVRKETAARQREDAARQKRAADLVRLSADRITTLAELPGFTTLKTLGIVVSLGAASGLTAGVKGREAAERVSNDFLAEARRLGANAVLGVHFATFGAGGGITSVLGGDAVGVLMVGTAAIVSPVAHPQPQASI